MHPSNDQRKVLAKLCMHVASTFESGRRKKEKPEIDGDGGMYGTAVHYHRHRGARQSTDVSSLEISDEDPVTNSCLSNDGRVIP